MRFFRQTLLSVCLILPCAFAFGQPVAVNDSPPAVNEDNNVVYNITANDTDATFSIDPATVDLNIAAPGIDNTFVDPGKGTFSVNGSGILTFIPLPNFNGTVTLQYTVQNNDAVPQTSPPATITVVIDPVNDLPTISVIAPQNIAEDVVGGTGALSFTIGDIETTAGSLTLTGVSDNLSLVPNANIVFGGSLAARTVTITPAANQNGTANITITVNDLDGGSSPISFLLTVSAVNDPPNAVNDVTSTSEDTPVVINVTINDIDDVGINSASVDLDPAVGGIQTNFTNAAGGWAIQATPGEVMYSPAPNYNGPASISYRVNDNNGSVSNVATLSVNVTSVNDLPVAANDITSTMEDIPVSFTVTTNDSDVEGSVNNATVDLNPATSTIDAAFSNASGNWSVSAGSVTYTPTANYNGAASVAYTVNDVDGGTSNSATLSITVTAANDLPTITNILPLSIAEDAPGGTGPLAFTVGDVETAVGSLTLTRVSDNLSLVPNANVVFGGSLGAKTVTVTPLANQSGITNITITVNDANGGSISTSFELTVTSDNDAPVAMDDITSTSEDIPIIFNVTGNDTDDGNINAATVDLNLGSAGIQSNFSNAFGAWSVNGTGDVTYSPLLNFSGPATVSYQVNDNNGTVSNTATISVGVTAVNDLPVAGNDNTSTTEDTPVSIIVTTNDSDVDGSVDVATVDLNPATPAIEPTFSNASGSWNVNTTTGQITYTPTLNFSGTASVTYRVNDNTGGTSNTATLSVTVTGANDAPTITTILPQSIVEDVVGGTGALSFTVGDVDTPVASLTLTGVSDNNALVPDANIVFGGSLAARNVTVTPLANQSGAANITITVRDGNGGSTPTTFVLTVTAVNDPPVVVNDNTTTAEDNPVSIIVTTNDSDVDGTVDVATVDLNPATPAIEPTFSNASGSWNVNTTTGQVTYTPTLNFNGPASVTYRVNDNSGATSSSATLSVTVTADNDLPTISAILPQTIAEDAAGGTGALGFTIGDAETPLASLTLAGVSDNTLLVPNGNITFGGTLANRTVTVVSALNQSGVANIQVTVSDGNGGSASISFSVTVNPVNDAPSITGQNSVSTNEEQNLEILFTHLTVTDPDNAYPTGFSLTVLANPTFYTFSGTTITPNPNVTGNIVVKVQVNDGLANSNIADLQVTVNPINDPPVITAQTALSINEDPSVPPTIQLSNLTIVDPDNSGFTLSLGNGGDYSLSGNQVIPNLNFNGTLHVPVTVSDGNSSSVPFDFVIQVLAVNDKPEISGQQSISIAEVQPVALSLSQLTVFDPDNTFPTGFSLFILSGADYSITGNTVTPIPNFSGTLKVKIFINDGATNGALNSDVYELQISVNSTNDAPIITGSDPLSTNEGQPITLEFDDLDVTDPDDTYPTDFTMTVLSGSNHTVSNMTITPAVNFAGPLKVMVKVNDGDVDSAPFEITISVIGINTAPTITGHVPLSVLEDNPLILQIAYLQITDPDSPSSALTMSVNQTPGTNYTVQDKTIIPAANFSGPLTVPVTVSDGALTSVPYNVQIQVTPVNDAPVIAFKNVLSTVEDVPITLTVDDFTITDVDNTSGFSIILQQGSGPNYSVAGTTITPNANFNGAFGIGVTVSDGGLPVGNTIEPTITVVSINDAPTLSALSNVTISEDQYPQDPLIVPLSGIGAGSGEETQILVVSASSNQPDWFETFEVIFAGGATASLRIKPKVNIYGSTQITVRIEDNGVASPAPNVNFVTQTFMLSIDPVNDLPVFISVPKALAEPGQVYEYSIEATDIESEVITLTATTIPAWLTLTLTANGKAILTGVPPANTTGEIAIVLAASDPALTLITNQSFSIVVNNRPVISSFNITLKEDGKHKFSSEFKNSFTDFDGNLLYEIQITQLPTKGTLKLNENVVSLGDTILATSIANSELDYIPLLDSIGTDNIKWIASDGTFYSLADGNITITIENVNDPPEIIAIEFATDTLQYELGSEIPVKLTQQFDARDVDEDDIIEAEIRFANPGDYRGLQDQFLFTNTSGIIGSFNEEIGILKLSGAASIKDYVAAIRSIEYNFVYVVGVPPPDPKDVKARAVSIRLRDTKEAYSETKERLVGLIYTFMDIDIASAFTPNDGDDKNQFWRIYSPNGLERYRDAQIRVYNKRGTLVHEATGFSVPWNGMGPEGALPADSYYYTIDLKYDKKKYKGVVTILR